MALVRAELLLVAGLACCDVASGHGFITTPRARNTLVCDKLWPDYLKHYNADNFVCKTDRESHCPPMPGKKEKDCQGSNTGIVRSKPRAWIGSGGRGISYNWVWEASAVLVACVADRLKRNE